MKGLMIKDFLTMYKQKMFFAVSIFLTVLNGANLKNPLVIFLFLGFFMGSIAISTITFDKMDNGLAYIFTLPASRKMYVLQKYLLLFAVELATLAMSVGLFFIMRMAVAGFSRISWSSIGFQTAVAFGLTLLYLSASLPLFIKFSSSKIQYVTMGLVIVMMVATFLIIKITQDNLFGLNTIFVKLLHMNLIVVGSIGVGASLLLFAVSGLISLKIISR